MLRNKSDLRIFAWANIVYKPILRLFDYYIRHIDPTAKYQGLPRRCLVFNFPYFVSWFSFFFALFFFIEKKETEKKFGKHKKKTLWKTQKLTK